jgi:hypothetical protein
VDAPLNGRIVDHQLKALVEPLAVGQQIVQIALSDDRAQRRLCHLGYSEWIVLDVDNRPHWIYHAEVNDSIHFDRDVVAGYAILRGHGHSDDLQVDLLQSICEGHHYGESRAANALADPAESEDQTALKLFDNSDANRGTH